MDVGPLHGYGPRLMTSISPPDAEPGVPTTWCEISRSALEANVGIFRRRLAPGARLGMVVKANAYGHGMVQCARMLVEAGVDWLVVNDVEEALQLRVAGLESPLYICGPVLPERAAGVVEAGAEGAL